MHLVATWGLVYIQLMRRIGILRGNILCPKRTFRAAIRKHLYTAMEESGVTLDEVSQAAVEKKF